MYLYTLRIPKHEKKKKGKQCISFISIDVIMKRVKQLLAIAIARQTSNLYKIS